MNKIIYYTKKKNCGFSLIELLIFIIILGILGSTLLSSYRTLLRRTPQVSQTSIASEIAEQCINWYVGHRKLYGYSSIQPPGNIVPSFCNLSIPSGSGYDINTSVNNTTILSDNNYETITVNVSYNGALQISTSLLIANY